MTDQSELFDMAPVGDILVPRTRKTDPPESHAAAERVAPVVSDLQAAILQALEHSGPMTAKEIEGLVTFERYGFSTVRKRVSELKQMGKITQAGTRDGCAIYKAV